MFRSIVVVLCCAALSACSGVGDVFLSAPEKVGKAFPPITEVRIGEEGLRALVAADPVQAKAFEQQYASRLALRALTCAQGLTIGRFDSIDKVKGYAVNRQCLAEQDILLMQYLGIRQIGYRLAQPALRPFLPLGPTATLPTGGAPDLQALFAASAAGVAVLVGQRGELASVEIPGGKKIAPLAAAPGSVQSVLLSPNGRVAAVRLHSNNSVMFVDTETGSKLWDTREIKQLYSWMPEVGAALAADGKTGALTLIDFQAGTLAAHPVALREQAWAVNVSTAPSRVLVAANRVFSLLEHVRDGGVNGTVVKEYHLPQGRSAQGAPTLMLGGKSIVFASARELMAVELASGKETVWPTGEFFAGRYAKLSETTLLFDTNERDGSRTKSVVFDITSNTLASVVGADAGGGSVTELPGRAGFYRRSYPDVWIGDSVASAAPVSIDSVIAAYNLARQIARLEESSRMVAREESAGAEMSISSSAPAFSFGGAAPSRPSTAITAGQDAIMSSLARTGRIEAVGVYQGVSASAVGQSRKVGSVTVRVRSGKPVLLVLSSYEPVRWTLVPEPGATILGVLVSGYHQSEVLGAGRARVLMSGSTYAYTAGSSEYRALNRQTLLYTGKEIDTFQGKYEGSAFTVGQ